MSGDTRVSVLTPPGTGAIATIEVSGPLAWELAKGLFRPAGKPLPELPKLHRFWFGRLGPGDGDEVILAVTAIEPESRVEVHCHGGRRLVQWICEQFLSKGCVKTEHGPHGSDPWQILTAAPTLRTASILLDQAHGAFASAVNRILDMLATDGSKARELLQALVKYSSVGRYLVEPWRVVVAGPPNVGKSSLVNAMAGYERAIVSEIAGTTRDIVTTQIAIDGWPVELTDSAGLRYATGLEAEGIERALRVLREADLILWVLDSSRHELSYPDKETVASTRLPPTGWLWVMNKSDRSVGWPPDAPPGAIHVSALTRDGMPALLTAIAERLVPNPPASGSAVPYTHRLADLVVEAEEAFIQGQIELAGRLLRECVATV